MFQEKKEKSFKPKEENSKKKDYKLYKHINTIGWENVKMELLEELTINNRKELLINKYLWIIKYDDQP